MKYEVQAVMHHVEAKEHLEDAANGVDEALEQLDINHPAHRILRKVVLDIHHAQIGFSASAAAAGLTVFQGD